MKNVTEVTVSEDLKMELMVIKNTHEFQWNNSSIEIQLNEYLKKFTGLIVTEDNLNDMEADKRTLASLRVKLETFRKNTKKQMELPVKAFEKQVSSLQNILSNVENPLADQLEKYEKKRINELRSEYMKTAKEIAIQFGVRDEYMFEFIIPSQWTMRSATKGKTIKAMTESIEVISQRQALDDTAKKQEQLKQSQIDMFCSNYSNTYSLNTPITAQDCAHETKDCDLMELPNIIETFAKKRAEVENKVIEVIAPVIAQPVQKQEPSPIIPSQFTDKIVTRITMRMSAEQLNRFDEFIKNINIEVIKREVK
jgi:hypothetical protein